MIALDIGDRRTRREGEREREERRLALNARHDREAIVRNRRFTARDDKQPPFTKEKTKKDPPLVRAPGRTIRRYGLFIGAFFLDRLASL